MATKVAAIFYDGEEMEAMRQNIPSMKRPGNVMKRSEVADMLGVTGQTVLKWERVGGPKWTRFAYDGVRSHILSMLADEEQLLDQHTEEMIDRINRISAVRRELLAEIDKLKKDV